MPVVNAAIPPVCVQPVVDNNLAERRHHCCEIMTVKSLEEK
jgi:hypothetical protein